MPIPDRKGLRGTGAPGNFLEELLSVDGGGNLDTPDAGKWEIKFHSGTALITLFRKEGQPRGNMKHMVARYGIRDKKGRKSFRHTLWSRSDKGFYVTNESDRLYVHNTNGDTGTPYWMHDILINAFISKLRRLVVVSGETKKINKMRHVKYDTAHAYREPKTTQFASLIVQGVIAIDFDARTKARDSGARNHGTKFRINYDDLLLLYQHREQVA